MNPSYVFKCCFGKLVGKPFGKLSTSELKAEIKLRFQILQSRFLKFTQQICLIVVGVFPSQQIKNDGVRCFNVLFWKTIHKKTLELFIVVTWRHMLKDTFGWHHVICWKKARNTTRNVFLMLKEGTKKRRLQMFPDVVLKNVLVKPPPK